MQEPKESAMRKLEYAAKHGCSATLTLEECKAILEMQEAMDDAAYEARTRDYYD